MSGRETLGHLAGYVSAYGLLVSGLFPRGSWSTLLAVAARRSRHPEPLGSCGRAGSACTTRGAVSPAGCSEYGNLC